MAHVERAPCQRALRTGVLLGALITLALLAGSTGPGQSQSSIEVDVAIVLAVDCSYSVDREEFELQMVGLAEAFRSEEVKAAIGAGPRRRIAVALVQWSGARTQEVVVPWTIVASSVAADALANAIEAAPRRTAEGATSLSGAINAGLVLHLKAPVSTGRRVIDISADGYNNSGGKADDARDRAVSVGLTINGLTILNQYWYLHHYFRNHVVGGPGSFVLRADDYGAYREAIRRKLLLEIVGPMT